VDQLPLGGRQAEVPHSCRCTWTYGHQLVASTDIVSALNKRTLSEMALDPALRVAAFTIEVAQFDSALINSP
jgi:hypothetical protein